MRWTGTSPRKKRKAGRLVKHTNETWLTFCMLKTPPAEQLRAIGRRRRYALMNAGEIPRHAGSVSDGDDPRLAVLEHLRVPAWILDVDRQRIVWANEEGLRFWGADDLGDLNDRDLSDTSASVQRNLERTRDDCAPPHRPRRRRALDALPARHAAQRGDGARALPARRRAHGAARPHRQPTPTSRPPERSRALRRCCTPPRW